MKLRVPSWVDVRLHYRSGRDDRGDGIGLRCVSGSGALDMVIERRPSLSFARRISGLPAAGCIQAQASKACVRHTSTSLPVATSASTATSLFSLVHDRPGHNKLKLDQPAYRRLGFPHVFTLGMTCVSLLLGSVHALSEDSGERKVIEELTPPWGAVGQVNVAGYRQRVECTGSLIAPNVVITAAHCVTDPFHRKPFPVDEIHFLAGVRGSTWLRHSTAKCLHFPADYDYGSQSFSKDLVLITLNDNFNDIVAMDLDRTDAQGPDISLIHAAYPADRRYVLTAQFGCHIVTQTQSLWLTNCDARPASSGGPILI